MGIKGVDIGKILEENRKRNKSGNNEKGKDAGGILSMANNPMVQMAIQNIPKKYKVLILLAFIFIVVGIVSTIGWIMSAFAWYPVISLKVLGGIVALVLFMNTVYKVYVNKVRIIQVILSILIDALILYWIIFN